MACGSDLFLPSSVDLNLWLATPSLLPCLRLPHVEGLGEPLQGAELLMNRMPCAFAQTREHRFFDVVAELRTAKRIRKQSEDTQN